MLDINITNETKRLRAVLVGIADAFGGVPSLDQCYDPKSKAHIIAGTYPSEKDCIAEMSSLIEVFKKYKIEVLRPRNIKGLNQIFSRDIAFVISDKLVIPNIIEKRKEEIKAIDKLINNLPDESVLRMPVKARVEGGDVIIWNNYIFVGYSENEDFERYTVARTNKCGLEFIAEKFPNKKVIGFELNKSDTDPRENALHLDCCFQPIGKDSAIIYKGGFKNSSDVDFLEHYFTKSNIIELTKEEMYDMNANIFSISESVIVSEKGFLRLNKELVERGFKVEEVPYSEIAKMEGLLRCSTMPLFRDR